MRNWLFFFLLAAVDFYPNPILEQISEKGYAPLYNKEIGSETFGRLYHLFDLLIEFCDLHPQWARSFSRICKPFQDELRFFGTKYIGYRDESKTQGRTQISFYYSSGFHRYLEKCHSRLLNESPALVEWLEACWRITQQAETLFKEGINALDLSPLFEKGVPILLKTIKYFSESYNGKAHFDISALSLLLDSTDNASLLLGPFGESVPASDFSSAPLRGPNTFLLIPGAMLRGLGIGIPPTPHVVLRENKIRYAAAAFLMVPEYLPGKIDLPDLPHF